MEGDKLSDQKDNVDVKVEDAISLMASDVTSVVTEPGATEEEEVKQPSEDSIPIISSYQIKPSLHDK